MNNFNWHTEVTSPLDSAEKKRAAIYEKIARLKGGINEDLTHLPPMEPTEVTEKKQYLFGILEAKYGTKLCVKIIHEAVQKKFNVDLFRSGEKVSINNDGGKVILRRHNSAGEVIEEVVINEPGASSSDRSAPPEKPAEGVESKESTPALKLSVAQREKLLNAAEGIGTPSILSDEMPVQLQCEYRGRKALLTMQINEGTEMKDLFRARNHVATWNGKKFNYYRKALDEIREHLFYRGVNETESLTIQWKEWDARVRGYADQMGVDIRIKDMLPRRKVIILTKDKKTVRIALDQKIGVPKNERSWRSNSTNIEVTSTHSDKVGSQFLNPMDAVLRSIAAL